eukprot:CAMPEP_0206210046 /NCGR_PEP_ID=MMETSP0166-20121206/17286_1 /ASSEMBLY_ACC=CAM_ASM_000260 /TAXON_ID=95228 /ORGANISM="Vannella robusta, Strain DIVA3 518/3/11/1/6" /LENGTH=144 /DNA_ID=CAMNT_0053631589 /DNA_START=382 /DNA_END=813 /DNA_ORIENTATION=-
MFSVCETYVEYLNTEGFVRENFDHFELNSTQEYVKRERNPNILLILLESASGLIFNSRYGKLSMPYYHQNISKMESFYSYEHNSPVSGLTLSAVPAILSGLNPMNKPGQEISYARNTAVELQNQGYHTAMFCSMATYYPPSGYF